MRPENPMLILENPQGSEILFLDHTSKCQLRSLDIPFSMPNVGKLILTHLYFTIDSSLLSAWVHICTQFQLHISGLCYIKRFKVDDDRFLLNVVPIEGVVKP